MGLFDSLFGSGSKSNQSTGLGALPQWAQTGFQDVYSGVQGLAPSTFAPAPFNPTQQSALAQLSSRPAVGNFNFGQQANDAFGQASAMGQTITPLINQGTAAVSGDEISQRINQFFNPYLQQVLDPTLRNIREQGAGAASDIRSLASEGGAFGGGRQALLEAELSKNLLQQVGDTTGQMYAQGFNAAAPLAQDTINQGRNRYLTGAGVASNSLANLSGLGANLMNARTQVEDIRRQQGLDTLTAGNQIQGQQTAVQQQDLSKLQALLSALQGLPGSGTGTERGATQGILGALGGQSGAAGGLESIGGGLKSVGGGLKWLGGFI